MMSRMETIDLTRTDAPLISCTEGHLPARDVKKFARWFDSEEQIVLHVCYYFAWDHECKALIRKDVHIMLKKGLKLGAQQAKLN